MRTANELQQVNFKGMREHVVELLRNAIIEGVFQPGEALRYSDLSRRLNVSTSPIREALSVLERECLVRNNHNKGWTVIKLTPEEISEIMSLRMVLEVVALRLARQAAAPADIEKLNLLQSELTRAVAHNDLVMLSRRDYEFHQGIWRLAGHSLLEDMLIQIVAPYFAFKQALIRRRGRVLKDYLSGVQTHELLIAYVAGKTDRSAEDCLGTHLVHPDWNEAGKDLKNWSRLLRIDCP